MKQRALKSKDDCSFWSSAKRRRQFSKINDSVKSSIQNEIISHPSVIKSPIEIYYIAVKFDDGIRGVNTELRQKVILQVSFHELHIGMQKNATGFSMKYDKKHTCLY